MKYRIIDKQNKDDYFSDGAIFDSKEAVRKQLISYHQTDAEEPEKLEKFTLEEILEWGTWDIELVKPTRYVIKLETGSVYWLDGEAIMTAPIDQYNSFDPEGEGYAVEEELISEEELPNGRTLGDIYKQVRNILTTKKHV